MKKILLLLAFSLFNPVAHASSVITFHPVEQGRKVIVDESMEAYFSRLQPMEMMAKTAGRVTRTKLADMRRQTREIYQQAVMAFSAEDKQTLQWYVDRYQPLLERSAPLLAGVPWQFVKLEDHIEGGLPHTRAKTIVLHRSFIQQLTLAKQMYGDKALEGAGTVLIHEQVHVAQRLHPAAFASLYEHWGFRKANVKTGGVWLLEHQLLNPDGTELGWIYPVKQKEATQWILPIVIFSEGEHLKHMPGDFLLEGIYLAKEGSVWTPQQQGGKPVMQSLDEMKPYQQAFPGVQSLYHPNEISADMITNMFVFDHLLDKSRLQPGVEEIWKNIFKPVRQVMQ